MRYLFILGREPKLSLVELESVFGAKNLQLLAPHIALVDTKRPVKLERLGGCLKVAQVLDQPLSSFLASQPAGKLTLGVSDYSPRATAHASWQLALKYKNLLRRHGRNVRLVPNRTSPIVSSATAHHNQLGEKLNHLEIIKYQKLFASSIGTQNITAYAKRDQARPARDAFVGMLPPKLAQILVNLAVGDQQSGLLLDPFCGTGVILQEASLMGFAVYGSDLSKKMVDYSRRNLSWLSEQKPALLAPVKLEVGDATSHHWQPLPNFIASEIFLGRPLSRTPSKTQLLELQHEARELLSGFLRNLANQLPASTTIALAIPAWKRPNGSYLGIPNLLDESEKLGYNAKKYRYASHDELLYHRENQVVARQIIVLRKK